MFGEPNTQLQQNEGAQSPRLLDKGSQRAFVLFWHSAHLTQTHFLSKAPFYPDLMQHTQHLALPTHLDVLKAVFHRNICLAALRAVGELLCSQKEPACGVGTLQSKLHHPLPLPEQGGN